MGVTYTIEGVKQALRHVELYRAQKSNSFYDDFYHTDLDYFQDLLEIKLAELKAEQGKPRTMEAFMNPPVIEPLDDNCECLEKIFDDAGSLQFCECSLLRRYGEKDYNCYPGCNCPAGKGDRYEKEGHHEF